MVALVVSGCADDAPTVINTGEAEVVEATPTGLPAEFTASELLAVTDAGLVFSALTYPDDTSDPVPVHLRSADGTAWEELDGAPRDGVRRGAIWGSTPTADRERLLAHPED